MCSASHEMINVPQQLLVFKICRFETPSRFRMIIIQVLQMTPQYETFNVFLSSYKASRRLKFLLDKEIKTYNRFKFEIIQIMTILRLSKLVTLVRKKHFIIKVKILYVIYYFKDLIYL